MPDQIEAHADGIMFSLAFNDYSDCKSMDKNADYAISQVWMDGMVLL